MNNLPARIGREARRRSLLAGVFPASTAHCAANGVACELVYPGAPNVGHATPTAYLIATLKGERE